MALKLEFINLIVPVETICEKLGRGAFEEYYSVITETTWNDGLLFRDGCMNEYDLGDMLDDWAQKGFKLLTEVDGQKRWEEVCVVYSRHGPSYPCDWIEYDAGKNIVWRRGSDSRVAVGPVGRSVAGEE